MVEPELVAISPPASMPPSVMEKLVPVSTVTSVPATRLPWMEVEVVDRRELRVGDPGGPNLQRGEKHRVGVLPFLVRQLVPRVGAGEQLCDHLVAAVGRLGVGVELLGGGYQLAEFDLAAVPR